MTVSWIVTVGGEMTITDWQKISDRTQRSYKKGKVTVEHTVTVQFIQV